MTDNKHSISCTVYTYNTGASILAGVGVTVVYVGLTQGPGEAHITSACEAIHQIL